MSQAFISWSGKRGEEFAKVLHAFLKETALELERSLDISFSSVSLQFGADWRKELHEQLTQAQIGIILLEPASLQSSWVAFESGFIAAASDEGKDTSTLFPLLLSNSIGAVKQTPFELLHCAVLSETGIQALLEALFNALKQPVPARALGPYVARGFETLSTLWRKICVEEAESHDSLLIELKRTIREYEQFGLVSKETTSQCLSLFDAIKNLQLFDELSQIAVLFKRCLQERNVHFSQLAIDWALPHLIEDTRVRLSDIARGRIPVRNRASVREFWLHSVIGNAQTSIWTTNLAKLGANMGSASDKQLLRVQEEATKKGVRITRMFVYDPMMGREEAEQRQNLMRRQIEAGIDVLVITEGEFRTRCDQYDAKRSIGEEDFLILDEEHLYLTRPEIDDIEAELLNGQQFPNQLRAAIAFREVLLGYADAVTLDNVSRFPNIAG